MDLGDAIGAPPDSAKAIKEGDEEEVVKLLEKDPALVNSDIRGYTPLAVAAAYGQLGMVRLLAQRGATVNEGTRGSRTAVHWAVEAGHQEVAAFLLSRNARADPYDHNSQTPLLLACKGGHVGIVRMLVHHLGGQGKDVGIQAATTALRWAARVGNAQMTRLMLSKEAQANTRDNRGRTALIEACSNGHKGIVQMIVQHSVDNGLDIRDYGGHTALYYAAHSGHEEIVAFLLGKGVQASDKELGAGTDTNLIGVLRNGHLGIVKMLVHHMGKEVLEGTDCMGHTALYSAALWGNEEMVAFLLSSGAQASSTDGSRETVLMGASMGGHLGVVQRLLQHTGEDGLEDMDDYGHTALYYAARSGHEEVVAFLLGKGVQANSRDTEGSTVLMGPCSTGHLGVVQMLMQHTGEEGLEDKDGEGHTALYHAARGGKKEVVAFLLGKGVKANDRDAEGKTALIDACMLNHLGVVRVLVQHTGGEGLNEREASTGRTALHWAATRGHQEMTRYLLVAGADPTITDNQGRTPQALAMETERVIGGLYERQIVAERKQAMRVIFQWWECELERRRLLYRATSLHKVYMTQRDKPTSQMPTYLTTRAAAGHELPSVEVVSPLSEGHEQQQEGDLAGASGKRKAADESGDHNKAEMVEDDGHAVLTCVVTALNEELVTELLEGFH